jgi:hypothetical protein
VARLITALCGRCSTGIMRPSHNPARAARRKEEALAQSGDEHLRCIYCGNADPLVVRPRRIQDHHFLSRERDSVTEPVCLNCHAVAHEHIRDVEVAMKCERDPVVFARAIFRLLAVHFSLLADACWRFAKKMDRK